MFKDQQEELRRLEAELLREEEEDALPLDEDEEEEWEAEEDIWDSQEEPDYRVYNSDRLDADVEDFGYQIREHGNRTRGRWTVALLLILLAALLLVLAFFLARFMGR